jgi:uncharacterized protein YndB with AHSA1/START domain
MAERNEPAKESGDREIVATRVFDAPRDLVFKMWTDPKHVSKWWGPRGFTTTTSEMDVRPGGVWRHVMHGPDGTDYPNRIVFIEVVRPERLVYKNDPDTGSAPVNFEVIVTFSEQGGKTKLTMRMIFPTSEARNFVVKEHGAVEGLDQMLARFDDQLALAAGKSAAVPGLGKSTTITRIFDAPRELVFKAWVDRERLQRWWGPKGFTNPVCEIDPRPGGAILIHMRAPDGVVYPMTGTFREIVEPIRLVFTSAALDKDRNELFENLNTVTFADLGGKTKLTLYAEVVKVTPAAPPYLAGMDEGWSLTLDRLAEEVSSVIANNANVFAITRVFDAPRELVFKALTESDRLAQWWGPKGFTWVSATLDLRPGGVFHYCMRAPNGQEMWGKFVYREIVAPERIVFVNSFADEKGNTIRHFASPTWPLEVLNVLTLAEHDGKTMLTMKGHPINATEMERKTFDDAHKSLERGFGGTLDQLAEYLAKA